MDIVEVRDPRLNVFASWVGTRIHVQDERHQHPDTIWALCGNNFTRRNVTEPRECHRPCWGCFARVVRLLEEVR